MAEHLKRKQSFNYFPWARAIDALLKIDPNFTFEIHRNENGRFWFDDSDPDNGKVGTAWVEVSVDACGKRVTEILPIMDMRNQPIKADRVTSFEANKAYKRCLVKAIACLGLGIEVFADEVDEPGEAAKKSRANAKSSAPAVSQELKDARQAIINLAKTLISEHGIDKNKIYGKISEMNNGKRLPNSIESVELCKEIETALNEMKDK